MARLPTGPTLPTSHPDIAAQMLIPQDPGLYTPDSAEVVWWHGPLGHVWCASIADRIAGRGCPVCSGLQAPSPGRSLTQVQPAAALDADGWDPSHVSAGSRVEMPWRCHDCGTTWTAEIRARANGHRPCPSCARTDSPSLTVTHPELASQMVAPFDPSDYTHGSKVKVRWRGPVGHEWEATIANRVKGSGCPVCSRGAGAKARQTPEPGASLADRYPDAAADADGWDPAAYRAKSSARLPWRCTTCGHQWTATIFARTQRYGCPACAKARRQTISTAE
jgi:protein-arginine kinase activator protein McsA